MYGCAKIAIIFKIMLVAGRIFAENAEIRAYFFAG
jgi:hypothetical protein